MFREIYLTLLLIGVVFASIHSHPCHFDVEGEVCPWEFHGTWQQILSSRFLNAPKKDNSSIKYVSKDSHKIAQYSSFQNMSITSPIIDFEGFYCLSINVYLKDAAVNITIIFSVGENVYDTVSARDTWIALNVDLGFLPALSKIRLEFEFDYYDALVAVDDIFMNYTKCDEKREIFTLWQHLNQQYLFLNSRRDEIDYGDIINQQTTGANPIFSQETKESMSSMTTNITMDQTTTDTNINHTEETKTDDHNNDDDYDDAYKLLKTNPSEASKLANISIQKIIKWIKTKMTDLPTTKLIIKDEDRTFRTNPSEGKFVTRSTKELIKTKLTTTTLPNKKISTFGEINITYTIRRDVEHSSENGNSLAGFHYFWFNYGYWIAIISGSILTVLLVAAALRKYLITTKIKMLPSGNKFNILKQIDLAYGFFFYFILNIMAMEEWRWPRRCFMAAIRTDFNKKGWWSDLSDVLQTTGSLQLLRMLKRDDGIDEIRGCMMGILEIIAEQDLQNSWIKVGKSSYCPFYKEIQICKSQLFTSKHTQIILEDTRVRLTSGVLPFFGMFDTLIRNLLKYALYVFI
uniref:MAM domain-containing protein n=1 Tax=Strigamia maritima TaxID=126957 RepID=T1INZ8_STRMM